MLRKSILVAFALVSIGFASQPANAETKDIGPKSKDYVEGKCNEKDGYYWANPEGTSWGCGYSGGGGILCDTDAGCSETTPGREAPGRLWGLIGLLGLVGLLGLRSRYAKGNQTANPAA